MKNNKSILNYLSFSHKEDEKENPEEALRQHNLLMTTILEKAPIGFAVSTINDGKAVFVSEKFEEIYGVARGCIKDIDSFFENVYLDSGYREEMKKKIMEDVQSGDISRMKWRGIHITTRNGQEKVINAMNIPASEHNLMVSIVEDVTDTVRLEEELKKSNKATELKLSELEKMNSLMVGRELKMVEMKKQIEELEKKLSEK